MRAELQTRADAYEHRRKNQKRKAANEREPASHLSSTQTPSLVCIEQLQFKTTVSIGSLIFRSLPSQ
jgi:hypothetical protein